MQQKKDEENRRDTSFSKKKHKGNVPLEMNSSDVQSGHKEWD